MAKKSKNKKVVWATLGIIVAVIMLFFAGCALAAVFGRMTNYKTIENLAPVGTQIAPTYDDGIGYYTYTVDRDFKVLQLTDVHIGGGAFSIQKDNWAINAVAKIVNNEKPDLVIVTGDIAYPVPFQAGTINNKSAAKMFADLMEKLEVYWTFSFGNHDTEAYSMFNRKQISKFYYESDYKYCLYQPGPENVDGYGNSMVIVKNTDGLIRHAFVTLDSHSYTGGDVFGIFWNYDNIHQNQVDWYKDEITKLNQQNVEVFNSLSPVKKAEYALELGIDPLNFATESMIKSTLYFHIPLKEYQDAWSEYVENGNNEKVEYVFGSCNEKASSKDQRVVYYGAGDDQVFETAQSLGSAQGIFCGHDHYNNFSVAYKGDGDRAVRLTYGMSIDYLAMPGIWKKTEQRGGTVIVIDSKGDFTASQIRLIDCN